MTTKCAWCGEIVAGEGDAVTHGICLSCVKIHFPENADGPKCRCLIIGGVWDAVLDDRTCDSCRKRHGSFIGNADQDDPSFCDHVRPRVA